MENVRCLICGMNINIKNYNLNSKTMVKKNEESSIINCPFCGVNSIYFDNNLDLIEIKDLDSNIINIFDKAMKLEIFNAQFYKEASKMAKAQNIKELFKELSNIEYMHGKIHKKLGGIKIEPKLYKPDYSKHNTDELLLKEASKREEHAIAFYNKYMREISSEFIKDIFKALIDVEKQHKYIAQNN